MKEVSPFLAGIILLSVWSGCGGETTTGFNVKLYGYVEDFEAGYGIPQVAIEFSNEEGDWLGEALSGEGGYFEFPIFFSEMEEGKVLVARFSHPSWEPVFRFFSLNFRGLFAEEIEFELGEKFSTFSYLLPFTRLVPYSLENGAVGGRVIDGTDEDAAGVGGLSLTLYEGIDTPPGYPSFSSTTTDRMGDFSFQDIPPGSYTLYGNGGTGWSSFKSYVYCVGGKEYMDQNGVTGPYLQEDRMYIFLLWGDIPPDLDLHLTAPIPSTGSAQEIERYHVYSDSPQYPPNVPEDEVYAVVLREDGNGWGPETILINKIHYGDYRCSAYLEGESEESTLLSSSDLKFFALFRNTVTFFAEIPSGMAGNVFRAFEFNYSTELFYPVMEFDYSDTRDDVDKF